VRYLVPWFNPDGSNPDDPCTPDEEETSDGEAEEARVDFNVQDNECGAWGCNPMDINEDCVVNLEDFAEFFSQWLSCSDPDPSKDCEQYND